MLQTVYCILPPFKMCIYSRHAKLIFYCTFACFGQTNGLNKHVHLLASERENFMGFTPQYSFRVFAANRGIRFRTTLINYKPQGLNKVTSNNHQDCVSNFVRVLLPIDVQGIASPAVLQWGLGHRERHLSLVGYHRLITFADALLVTSVNCADQPSHARCCSAR